MEKIAHKAVTGVVALTLSQAVLLVLTLVTNIVLARLLAPADVGIYALFNAIVLGAYFFTDVGLAGTLIQRAEDPRRRELQTVFTIQMMLTLMLAGCLVALAPMVIEVYRLDERLAPALSLLSLGLLVTPVESVAGVVLERRLRYPAVGVIHLLGGTGYAAVSIGLARAGAGVWSLVAGSVAAGVVRATGALFFGRVPVGVAMEREFLRRSLPSGLMYQLGGIMPLIRDSVPLVVAGAFFGPTAVGYLAWARTLTYGLTNVVAHAWGRVAYSTTARLHAQREPRSLVIEKMALTLMLVVLPISMLFIGLGRPIISIVFTEKWLAAAPMLALFGLRMIGASLVVLSTAVLNGEGRFPLVARILAVWTLVEIGAAVLLGFVLGPIGIALAAGGSVAVPVVWMLHALAQISPLTKTLARPTGAALVGGLVLRALSGYVTGPASLVIVAAGGLAVYLVVVLLTIPEIVTDLLKTGAWMRYRYQEEQP